MTKSKLISPKIEIKKELDADPNGFYKLSDEVYFSQPQMSNSDLNQLARSPMAYWHYINTHDRIKTPQMELGSLVHCMYLEPEETETRYLRLAAVDKRTKAGKEFMLTLKTEHKEKTFIESEVYDQARDIVGALMTNLGPVEKVANANGFRELAAFWPLNGVPCRGKIDFLDPSGFIYDLKTTSSLMNFEKSIANYFYHRQAAFYGMGLSKLIGKFKGFRFIVVETSAPYESAVFELDLESIKRGKDEIMTLLETYQTCRELDKWEGRYDKTKIHYISLPKWY